MTTKGRPSKRCFDCEADGTSEAAGSRPVRRRRSSSSSTSPGDDEQYHSGSEITSDIELTPACTPEPVPASVESRWFPNGEMPLPVGAPCDAKDCMLPKAAPMHALSQIMAKRSVGSSEANHKETASDLVAAMAHGSEIVDKVYRQAISESFEGMNGPLAPPAESREAIKDYVLSKLPDLSGVKARLQDEVPHTRAQLKGEFVKAGCVPPKFRQDTVEVLGHEASVIHRVSELAVFLGLSLVVLAMLCFDVNCVAIPP